MIPGRAYQTLRIDPFRGSFAKILEVNIERCLEKFGFLFQKEDADDIDGDADADDADTVVNNINTHAGLSLSS